MTRTEILQRLEGVQDTSTGWSARCPAHDDQRASMSVRDGDDGRILVHCHAGCAPDQILAAMGLTMSDLFPPRPATRAGERRLVRTYPYTNAEGQLLFEVCRYEPKDFRQRRPDGAGGWVYNMQGVERVLYHLPQLQAAVTQHQRVFLPEGERDVETLEHHGYAATCNPGGAGKWQPGYTQALTGADVIVIADKDEPGRRHAAMVQRELTGHATSVVVIEMPDRDDHAVKDVSDWFATGGTPCELNALLENPPAWTPPQASGPSRRSAAAVDPIILPGNGVSIGESATTIFERMAPLHRLFIRGGAVMELHRDDDGRLRLDVVESHPFRSRIEELGDVMVWRSGPGGERVLKPTVCPQETAAALLTAAAAEEYLPHVRGIVASPVLANVEGRPVVLTRGYHDENGGLLVTSGDAVPEVPLDEAVATLKAMFDEFDFATPSDRSRALASLITPALRHGGWLSGHLPLDMAEADRSQSGKTYRQKLTFAVYNEEPYRLALKNGGVGGLDESIAQALIAGRPFIQVDNVRGRIDSQFVEMMVTAGGMVPARVPYHGEVQIDARHFLFFLTSNGIETTRDLANRSNIVRIRKRQRHVFRTFPEGDLLDHIKARQPYFLGSVFAVVRAWVAAGQPKTCDVRHDFRPWAQTLDWVVQNILHEAPLLDGHDMAQERVSNPSLVWLRLVALAVEAAHRLGEEFSASAIGDLCEDSSIEVPGLVEGQAAPDRRCKRIGLLMRNIFGQTDAVTLDRHQIHRSESVRHDERNETNRTVKTYRFELGDGTEPPAPTAGGTSSLGNHPIVPEVCTPCAGAPQGNAGVVAIQPTSTGSNVGRNDLPAQPAQPAQGSIRPIKQGHFSIVRGPCAGCAGEAVTEVPTSPGVVPSGPPGATPALPAAEEPLDWGDQP